MTKELMLIKSIQDIYLELNETQCLLLKEEQLLQNSVFFHKSDLYKEVIFEIIKQENVVIVSEIPKDKTFTKRAFSTFAYLLSLTIRQPQWTFFIHAFKEEKSGVKFIKLYVEDSNGEEVKKL